MKGLFSILFVGFFLLNTALLAQKQSPESDKKAALMRIHDNYAPIANKKNAPKHIRPYHKTISSYMLANNLNIGDYYASLQAAPALNGHTNILIYHFDSFAQLDSLKNMKIESGQKNPSGFAGYLHNPSGKDAQLLIDPKTKKVVAYNIQFKKE